MDTLKDIWASMVAGVQERTTNPLTFSFIASWCLWNYKFFIILAGDGTTAARLQAVDALFPCTLTTYATHAFGFPLLTALAYVFAYPHISAKVIHYYRTQQVNIANAVREIEGDRLLTVEESSKLRRSLEAERATWEERESKLQDDLKATRALLAAAERDVNELKNSIPVTPALRTSEAGSKEARKIADVGDTSTSSSLTSKPLPNLNVELLTALSNYTGDISLDVLASNQKVNPTVAKRALRSLERDGLVKESGFGEWKLTEEGEEFVVPLLHLKDKQEARRV